MTLRPRGRRARSAYHGIGVRPDSETSYAISSSSMSCTLNVYPELIPTVASTYRLNCDAFAMGPGCRDGLLSITVVAR